MINITPILLSMVDKYWGLFYSGSLLNKNIIMK